jgi:hypothetical protein
MEDLLQRIKADRLTARKAKDTIRATLLTTLVGEAETALKGKQAAKFDMLKLVKKFQDNCNETLAVKFTEAVKTEVWILEGYLPEMIEEDELSGFLDIYIENGENNIGKLMGHIKRDFENGTVDMGMASALIKARIKLTQ